MADMMGPGAAMAFLEWLRAFEWQRLHPVNEIRPPKPPCAAQVWELNKYIRASGSETVQAQPGGLLYVGSAGLVAIEYTIHNAYRTANNIVLRFVTMVTETGPVAVLSPDVAFSAATSGLIVFKSSDANPPLTWLKWTLTCVDAEWACGFSLHATLKSM